MVLELSNSVVHNPNASNANKHSDEELKSLLLDMIKDSGIDVNAIKDENGVLALDGTPNLKLHSMMLQAEEFGLSLKYTKKTLIEIC